MGNPADPPTNPSTGSEYNATILLHALSCRPCSIAARVFNAQGKPLEPVTRGTFNYTGVSVLSLKHDDDTATGNRAAVASAPLPSPTFGMVLLSSSSSASQHASI
jgi:hypothetical protein